jgi:D-alanine--poly(phosphoribitol) ligase subunit 1
VQPNGVSADNLWEAFATAVRINPEGLALIFPDRRVTFAQLKHYAECCAEFLHESGVGRDDAVALQLPKRVETYALMLACLRLGVPYVCIDPKNPPERTECILERVRPAFLFTTTDEGNGCRLMLHFRTADSGYSWLQEQSSRSPTRLPRQSATGADPAYIMFTSGSTGEPKGAVIPHQGVLTLMSWCRNEICTPQDQRFTNINPLHFDNSVFDFYCGLLNGATLVPVETGEVTNPAAWLKLIREGEGTVLFAVPTLFLILDRLSLLSPIALPTIKTFMFGGEGFPIGKLRQFFHRFKDRAKLVNVYGPTETSCICTSITVDESALDAPDTSFPPLGRMHTNFSRMILDEERNPVAAGEAGELWIGGPCVGLGYYANPEETVARFLQDPTQNRFRSIFYRSGDLVREDNGGKLWFLGRVDNQVKIRGHRIELEEVDLAVQRIEAVRRALTVVLDGVDGQFIAVAFTADRSIAKEEVIEFCKGKLPSYMLPGWVVQLEDLPRNANGKADRRAVASFLRQERCEARHSSALGKHTSGTRTA